MKTGEALRGREGGKGQREGSTEEPCTSASLGELGLKALETLGGCKRKKDEEKRKGGGKESEIMKIRGGNCKGWNGF